MKKKEREKFIKREHLIRNILIGLTIVSLIITLLNFTYLVYQDRNIDIINNLLVNYINGWLFWIDNILVIVFALWYIVLALQSKCERVIKISFSIFSIVTTILVSTLVINFVAELFQMI